MYPRTWEIEFEHLALGRDRMQRRKRTAERDRVAHEPPPREHDRRYEQRGDVDRSQLPAMPDDNHHEQQRGEHPDRLLGKHRQRHGEPHAECEPGGQHLTLHDDDPRENQQRAGEPCEVVVVDPARQVLRLRQERDQGRGAHRKPGAERKEPSRHGVNREDRQDAEPHGEQADQAGVVTRELRHHRSEQVVQGRLLTLRLACRRETEVVRDAGDVVQVGHLVGRGADRRDPRVGDRETGEDNDQDAEQHALEMVLPSTLEQVLRRHGSVLTLSALTHTVSG